MLPGAVWTALSLVTVLACAVLGWWLAGWWAALLLAAASAYLLFGRAVPLLGAWSDVGVRQEQRARRDRPQP